MKVIPTLSAAIVSAAALLGAVGAQAQTPHGYYVAVPAVQPARDRIITRSTPWRLEGGAYVAAQAPERAQVLCELVARDAGTLASFAVAGKAYDADQLAACNAKVKRKGTDTAAVAR